MVPDQRCKAGGFLQDFSHGLTASIGLSGVQGGAQGGAQGGGQGGAEGGGRGHDGGAGVAAAWKPSIFLGLGQPHG